MEKCKYFLNSQTIFPFTKLGKHDFWISIMGGSKGGGIGNSYWQADSTSYSLWCLFGWYCLFFQMNVLIQYICTHCTYLLMNFKLVGRSHAICFLCFVPKYMYKKKKKSFYIFDDRFLTKIVSQWDWEPNQRAFSRPPITDEPAKPQQPHDARLQEGLRAVQEVKGASARCMAFITEHLNPSCTITWHLSFFPTRRFLWKNIWIFPWKRKM